MNDQIKRLLQGIDKQEREDCEMLHLTAYENSLSANSKKLLASPLSQRYLLGTLESRGNSDPGAMGEFLFKGMVHVNQMESVAQKAALKMFLAKRCDLRPLSGMHAMITSLITTTSRGDTIYSIACDSGGHFATHNVLQSLGRTPATIPINTKTHNIDLCAFEQLVKTQPPQGIYLDVGCPLFPIPLREIRQIVGPDVLMIYDASHTFGLIAGGKFQSPLEQGADILQGNTHKTFPGPHKGMVFFANDKQADKVIEGLSSGFISSQHTNHALALYLTILEMAEFGSDYAGQMIANAKALAKALTAVGIELLASDLDYTESNVLLIKGDSVGGHVSACRKLYECNIASNSRHAYGEEVIRLGVQEVTRRGMKEEHMLELAQFFKQALIEHAPRDLIRKEVSSYMKQFKTISYSFDQL